MRHALPDLFRFEDGGSVRTPEDWRRRRAELLELLLEYEYGHPPPAPARIESQLLMRNRVKGLGRARQWMYRVSTGAPPAPSFLVSVFLPDGDGPFPAVLHGDGCWPETDFAKIGAVLERGYLFVQFNRLEFAGDNKDLGRKGGLYQAHPGGDFGALAAWAWGYSRAVDFLLTLDVVQRDRIAALGASRGGKTVLLAAALDERIALAAPSQSGCCGAGCFRHQGAGAETLKEMIEGAGFWLSPRLAGYVGREHELPFDQHALKACIAPRALVSTEALGDLYANPTGTWITHLAAREVYRFLGAEEQIGIWYRPGEHSHILADWQAFLDFADLRFFGKKPAQRFDACPFPELPVEWKGPGRAPGP